MLMLRLARAGSKKRPVYHLVAADKRARRDGRFIENLGYYIPTREILVLHQDRVDHWLSVGAQVTATAKAVIKKARRHGNTPPPAQKKAPPAPVKTEAPPAKAEAAPAKAPEAAPPAPAPEAEAPAAPSGAAE